MVTAQKPRVTCFDIGGSFIRHASLLPDGGLGATRRAATPREDFSALTGTLREAVQATAAEAVSVSLAGTIDGRTGLSDVANIPCLNRRHVVDDLCAALGVPVLITNDADCFALAEAHEGAGRGANVVFGIIIGSGVGGGVIVRGWPLQGHGGVSGEWGHGPVMDPTAGGMVADMPQLPCGCGLTGCIDAVCSARGMEALHLGLHGEDVSSMEITSRWKAGETRASATIDLYVRHLARALSVLVNTLGPEVVPVSGGLSSEPELIAAVDREVRGLVIADYPEPLVMPGLFAANGGLVGAGIVARQQFWPDGSAG